MSSFDTLEIYSKQIINAFTNLERIIKQSTGKEILEQELNDQFTEELKNIQGSVNYILNLILDRRILL
jgi:hypothetical protein